MSRHRFRVDTDEEGLRLDSFLALRTELDLSRSYLGTLIRNGHITLDGEICSRPSRRVRTGSIIEVEVPAPVEIDLEPEEIPLDIVFEDEHLLVIDKQAGLVVHPAATAPTGTLVHGLLAHCGDDLSGIAGEMRPGIVHRLDKDTTGLLVVAKDDATHRGLSSQLIDKSMGRRYLALAWRTPSPNEGRVDRPIGRDPCDRTKMAVIESGRHAVTNYRLIRAYGDLASLLECVLETGRTHQIRVHLARILECPVIGDPVYGSARPRGVPTGSRRNREAVEEVVRIATHQLLHAETLRFVHPVTGEEMEFSAAPPLVFSLARKRLERYADGE